MPADVWPTFWERISDLINDGSIFSSEKVREEINHGKDELTTWMRNHATQDFYISLDAGVLSEYSKTLDWAKNNPVFSSAAINDYAVVADAYLVATAAAKNMTLVTYETSDPLCKRKVKIPDACNALGVRYCDLNTALRELGVTI